MKYVLNTYWVDWLLDNSCANKSLSIKNIVCMQMFGWNSLMDLYAQRLYADVLVGHIVGLARPSVCLSCISF